MKDKKECLNFLNSLPKKRMGAGVLFFYERKLLIVKPSYKDHWLTPGGIVEKDESPRETCEREAKEEIGLSVKIEELICVDYIGEKDGASENIQFVFLGGNLSSEQVKNIKIDGKEIVEYGFFNYEDALEMLSEKSGKRIKNFLDNYDRKSVLYLENGDVV